MTQSACMSEADIQLVILKSHDAMMEIKSFVAELERQGVIELFISKSAFDAFVRTLVEEQYLHEQYKMLEISGKEVIENFTLYYVQLIARYMQANQYNESYDAAFWVKQFVDLDREPQNIMSVYMTLLEFSYEVSKMYNEAMSLGFLVKEDEYKNTAMNTNKRNAFLRRIYKMKSKLHMMFMDAFPCGTQYTAGPKQWIKMNKELYSKIWFDSIIFGCPYESIQSYFDDSQSELLVTNKPKDYIEKKQREYFEGILLEDVLSRIRSKKDQTEVVINETMHALYRERPIFVHIRMVQACYMFYRMDFLEREEEKLVYMFSHMPELFSNSSWGGINIPS